ncbi:M2 family metallopeptidase [Tautonia sociabilis]|uniref:Peptidase n=1 Tax=Tautonia sociabilis TaxID=2080755 RepID=A0A432MEC5_9BACT|nr:M2 family metallopeptidase [Tautonia sociabilis]RUL83657.1 peptidase [Tautonia sociabilis]
MEPTRTDRRTVLRLALLAASGGPMTLARAVRAGQESAQEAADAFLSRYVAGWLPLDTAASEAAWAAMTDVSEEHTRQQVEATLAVSRFVGDPEVIATARALLERADALDELTVRQLRRVILRAAEAPGTIPEVVERRAEAEASQSALQDGFVYPIDDPKRPGERISANGIDRVLVESDDLGERLAVWTASKTIGAPLRDGLLRLRDLRNSVARELGFDDFFALQVADYGISVDQMIALCDGFVATVKPLYEQLHTWAKYRLAERFGVDPPEGKIPAHWLPNRWGQLWPGLVEGIDLDAPFRGKPPEFITEQAERFYVSIGFPALPRSFHEKSDLYPVPPGSSRKKNSHASAWHINLEDDVRSLMSIEPDARWFNTAHHELGHIYYYISYSRPEVPHLLREGANRAFHEGIGDLIGLAAGQRPYLKQVGLLTPEAERADPVRFLLDSALDGASIVFIPWSAGVMTHWERAFYAGTIPDHALNASWWEMAGRFQGIAPPSPRPETTCDPATKTHINDDPAQYYDYAIGTVIKFQLHDHIARTILKQDPRECNYYGNTEVGAFLRSILELGATRDWNAVLQEATGSGLSADAMMSYFAPLSDWLQDQNAGRPIGWS